MADPPRSNCEHSYTPASEKSITIYIKSDIDDYTNEFNNIHPD